MRKSFTLLLTAGFLLLASGAVYSQGCVAIRHFSSCNGNNLSTANVQQNSWQLGTNYRYFKSFRHFRGNEEEPDRIANNTEVINYSHALDINLTYGITNRLFANLSLPIVYNERSSLYEHGRTERKNTYSSGLADARVGLGYWLISPEKNSNGNIALGLGVKLPTGAYNAKDTFYNVGIDGQPEERPVDQSIQPGDGGFGLAFDFQLYQKIVEGLYAYGGGFYLLNPRETNGTRSFRETLSPLLLNESIMSVPDQYAFRGGINYNIAHTGVGVALGGRFEGVPVRDLVGGSNGFRRPGYVMSAEPGLNYMKNNLFFNLSVPIALVRNRTQSVTDREIEIRTETPRHGDAAFADYVINVGVTYRFLNKL